MIDKGTKALGGLFGDKALGGLTDVLGRFSGLAGGSMKSLLGMLAPLVMGVLFKQKTAQGLDAGGLGRLLASQKDHIAAALPSGLGSLLSGAGLVDGLLGGAGKAAAAAGHAAMDAGRAAGHATASAGRAAGHAAAVAGRAAEQTAASGGSLAKRLLPLLLIAVLAVLAWQLFLKGKAKDVVSSATSTLVGGVDLAKEYGGVVTGLTKSLSGVTDAVSARAALPDLEKASGTLDRLAGLAKQLPAGAADIVKGQVRSATPGLKGLIDKLLGTAGMPEILKPVLDAILSKLAAFTG
jgi:hypothetical protein